MKKTVVTMLKKAIKIVFLLAVLAAAVLSGWFMTVQEKFVKSCTVCHEMQEHQDNMKLASHNEIDCRECHEPGSVFKMALVKIANSKNKFKNITVVNERCARCHPSMKETTVFYHDVKFSHDAHLEAGEVCSGCHRSFVHREASDSELITLRQCRECHTKKRHKGAPPEAIPDSGELEKQPHGDNWYVEHKTTALQDNTGCADCHHEDFCNSCHNNYRTHMTDWWSNHYDEAMIRLNECQICHRPDYCISCHKGTIPKDHTPEWGMNHWENADLASCNTCHTLNFCKSCHTRDMPASHVTIKDHAGMTPEREPQCNVCHGENSCSSCHHKPDETEKCVVCHSTILDAPIKVSGQTFSHSMHVETKGLGCEQCHVESEEPGIITSRADCSACHHTADNSACMGCHGATARSTVSVKGKKLSHASHVGVGGMKCSGCHMGVDESGQPSPAKECGDCHHEQGEIGCFNCHDSESRIIDKSAMDFHCEFCHRKDNGDFEKPVDICKSCHVMIVQEETPVHGADSCMDCHDRHDWHYESTDTCKGCHASDIGKHDPVPSGSCTTCHPPHKWIVRVPGD